MATDDKFGGRALWDLVTFSVVCYRAGNQRDEFSITKENIFGLRNIRILWGNFPFAGELFHYG